MGQTIAPAPTALPGDAAPGAMPEVVDQVALARLYGEPLFALPRPASTISRKTSP